MQTYLLDTNVLVRFLVGDVPEQYNLAKEWFALAESGQREILISSLVIAESIYVLRRVYKKTHMEVSEVMQGVISQRWPKVDEREMLRLALKVYGRGIHFVDGYLLATGQTLGFKILTFDKKLKKQSESEF